MLSIVLQCHNRKLGNLAFGLQLDKNVRCAIAGFSLRKTPESYKTKQNTKEKKSLHVVLIPTFLGHYDFGFHFTFPFRV